MLKTVHTSHESPHESKLRFFNHFIAQVPIKADVYTREGIYTIRATHKTLTIVFSAQIHGLIVLLMSKQLIPTLVREHFMNMLALPFLYQFFNLQHNKNLDIINI